ncbi:MerR family transcriptional regulator [Paenibacillus sp. FSL R7-0345]|uniref:MerR family transcriptional regulator n=1 Tax=Paenibacillus sp. FSL R7-0345 TaxID=2954535 RepID=UPI00315A43BF
MKTISIGEAAAALRIPESTLRYYEKQGLLPLIERDGAGRRLFSEHQMELLETILRLKHTHMPIQDIRQYIAWVIEGESTTELRLEMMTRHKQAVPDCMYTGSRWKLLQTEFSKGWKKEKQRSDTEPR